MNKPYHKLTGYISQDQLITLDKCGAGKSEHSQSLLLQLHTDKSDKITTVFTNFHSSCIPEYRVILVRAAREKVIFWPESVTFNLCLTLISSNLIQINCLFSIASINQFDSQSLMFSVKPLADIGNKLNFNETLIFPNTYFYVLTTSCIQSNEFAMLNISL